MTNVPPRSRTAPKAPNARGRRLLIFIPYLWLTVFFLVPFLIVLKISLSQTAIAQPPYTPVLDLAGGLAGLREFLDGLSLDNYALLASDQIYLISYARSVVIAASSTAMLLLIGFPLAYGMARAPRRWQAILFMLVVLPFWTSFLIRIYAWINILQHDGLLNQLLLALRIVDEPPSWLASDTAIYIGIVYSYLPFMVLPIYATLEKVPETLLEAAADLGCPRWKAFWLVTAAAVAARRDRRIAALLHPDRRRVRHSGSPGRLRFHDDRADIVGRVLQQPGLAGRVRGRGRAARPPGGADRDLPAAPDAPARRRAARGGC